MSRVPKKAAVVNALYKSWIDVMHIDYHLQQTLSVGPWISSTSPSFAAVCLGTLWSKKICATSTPATCLPVETSVNTQLPTVAQGIEVSWPYPVMNARALEGGNYELDIEGERDVLFETAAALIIIPMPNDICRFPCQMIYIYIIYII